jgi:ribonuclease Z
MFSMSPLFRALLVALALLFTGWTYADDGEIKVTLLGTGSPNPSLERFSMSTLVTAGGQNLLFDAGRGSSIRLWQAGVPIGKLDAVFLTHYHSDHTVGLPDIWLTGWIDTPYGRRKQPLRLIGPSGVLPLARGLEAAYADDVTTRVADEHLSADAARIDAREFSGNGVAVFEHGGVRVTAFEVDHGDKIKPAYGYRIDYNGHSVLISGDTRRSDNLVKFATGVDLLIHEVCMVNEQALASNQGFQAIVAHHVTPADAGAVFTAAKPKLAVYSHLVFLSDTKFPRPTVGALIEQTRKTYNGPLVVGQDLMAFSVGEEVKQLPSAAR